MTAGSQGQDPGGGHDAGLLASDRARSAWLGAIARHGLQGDALNA